MGRKYVASGDLATWTAAGDIVELIAPSDAVVVLHALSLHQSTTEVDDSCSLILSRVGTSGSGGGTISTTAIYSGKNDIIKETLNLDFIKACESLFENNLVQKISCMMDVTNGGLRNELSEAIADLNLGVKLEAKKIKSLVNPKVFQLLQENDIDYLGVSLDRLNFSIDSSIFFSKISHNPTNSKLCSRAAAM